MRFLVPLHKFSSICRKTQISTFISIPICLSFCFSATVGRKPAHKNATIFATFPQKQSEAGKSPPRFSYPCLNYYSTQQLFLSEVFQVVSIEILDVKILAVHVLLGHAHIHVCTLCKQL